MLEIDDYADRFLDDSSKEIFNNWIEFLYKKIDFNLPNSPFHNKPHCSRVMLLALLLAQKYSLSYESRNTLAIASVFHDSFRCDDGIDKGHGLRGAIKYRKYCKENDESIDFCAFYLMALHDCNDSCGLNKIKKYDLINRVGNIGLLYEIFKDADGLDRIRLGGEHFDKNFLRLYLSHSVIDLARDMIQRIKSYR